MTETTERLQSSPAAAQWQKIGIRQHHGIVVPLFSLHSQTSCGIGEFPDLIALFPWCRSIGLDVIQLLPLNDPGLDTSPYCALSAYALNPIHLGLSQLPHVAEHLFLQQQIGKLQQLNSCQRVNYAAVQAGKESFLRDYYSQYGASAILKTDYQQFKKQNKSWLNDYTLFKTLKIKLAWQNWETWPEPYINPSPDFLQHLPSDIAAEMDFHCFVQYCCFKQFSQVKQQATIAGIFIKGDIPILINRESADVWHRRDLFMLEFAAGAPPDMYAQEGQKWGFPLYQWEALAAQGYRWWIERLKVASAGYHLYRIDHIVGFFRIWAIPIDKSAIEGHFIPSDENTWIPHGKNIMEMMLANNEMLPIGEDLGTVPPEVRVCLRALGICGTKVMRWERRWHSDQSFIDPKAYIPESMTTVSTHDSETLALWWQNRPDESQAYAAATGMHYTPQLTYEQRIAILYASHHSGSLFHINLLQEYLALIPNLTWPDPEDERINIPGLISERNWSYRFRPSVEEIVGNPTLEQAMKAIVH